MRTLITEKINLASKYFYTPEPEMLRAQENTA